MITDEEIFKSILQSCSSAKGTDLIALDVNGVFDLASKFIIVSGRSDRHVQGISNRISADLTEKKIKPLDVEGYQKAHWILMDYNDIIVHIFYQPTREIYDLESLWDRAKKIPIAKELLAA